VSSPHNPFETPLAEVGVAPSTTPYAIEDERVRRELLNHEASIRAVGTLMILGGVFAVLAGLSLLVAAFVAGELREMIPVVGLTVGYLGLGVGSVWVGYALRMFDPRGRIPGAIINGFGLVGFPVGTLISAYILYLLLSEKGRRVLSPEYQGVIARTPHIRYQSSIVVIVLVVVVLVAAVAALFVTLA
jgi:hypothetical protein